MASKISFLDCTLRDGGYRNDWHFGKAMISDIIQGVDAAHIEYVELGFLQSGYEDSPDHAKFSDPKQTQPHVQSLSHSRAMCMVRTDRFDMDHLSPRTDSSIDTIRYLFSVDDASEVQQNINRFIEKGYTLFLQPFGTKYADKDALARIIDKLPDQNIMALSIVDTYGNLTPEECQTHMAWLDKRLPPEMAIGLHLHDNSGLAMANMITAIEVNSNRHLIIDSCITGFGLGAGNLKTEQALLAVNHSHHQNYDIKPILDVIQNHFISSQYDTALLLCASLNLHPKYGMYLFNQPDMTLKKIYEILQQVPESYLKKFSDHSIEAAFKGLI